MTSWIFLVAMASAGAPEWMAIDVADDAVAPGLRTTVTVEVNVDTPQRGLSFDVALTGGFVIPEFPAIASDCGGQIAVDEQGLAVSGVDLSDSCTLSFHVQAVDDDGSVTASFTSGSPGASTILELWQEDEEQTLAFSASRTITQVAQRLTYNASRYNSGFTSETFDIHLDDGLVFADPPRASIACPGAFQAIFTPAAGARSATANTLAIDAGIFACELSADVVATAPGALAATASASLGHGFAYDVIEVAVDPVEVRTIGAAPGGLGELQFTVRNRRRGGPMTDLGLTTDLDAVLSGLVATTLPSEPCGPGSSLSGTSQLSLVAGSLAEGERCDFTVPIAIPAGAAAGDYPGVTSTLSFTQDGVAGTEPAAAFALPVNLPVTFAADVQPAVVPTGGELTVQFTVQNDGAQTADVQATLPGHGWIPGMALVEATTDCTSGTVYFGGDPVNFFFGAPSLAAGESCTATYILDVPAGLSSDRYEAGSTSITATVDGTAQPLFATLGVDVVGLPSPRLAFADSRVLPGESTTFTWSLDNTRESAVELDGVSDVLAVSEGLTLSELVVGDGCGSPAVDTGVAAVVIDEVAVAAGAVCTLSWTATVSGDSGEESVATDGATWPVGEQFAEAAAAEATLSTELPLANFALQSDVTHVAPGGSLTLTWSVENLSDDDMSQVQVQHRVLQDFVDWTLDSVVADAPCRQLANQNQTSGYLFIGTGPAAGETCSVAVSLTAPDSLASAELDVQVANISLQWADGSALQGSTDTVHLTVGPQLSWSAELDPSTALPGDSVALHYHLDNLGSSDLSGLGFTHALADVLPGLLASRDTDDLVCGDSSSLGTGESVSLSGAQVAGEGSCSFTVTLDVPTDAVPGSRHELPTSVLTDGVLSAEAQVPVLTIGAPNCRDGFRQEGGLCVDIDECAEQTAGCAEVASCTNTEGGFSCDCDSGYEGDGFVCSDVDECELDPCADDATCTNDVGDFDCACDEGFEGDGFLDCDPVCGDGLVVGDEACDEGDANGPDGDCLSDCTLPVDDTAEPVDDTDLPNDTDGEGVARDCGCSGTGAPPAAGWTLLLLGLVGLSAARRR